MKIFRSRNPDEVSIWRVGEVEEVKGRVSEIGCPGARDTCLTAAVKYLPHISCPPGIHSK
jgi:hypothetical protein